MLTDFSPRNLKPRSSLYKVFDREGMYVAISPTGSISFRYDYSINGRRETLTIGRYGFGGISLISSQASHCISGGGGGRLVRMPSHPPVCHLIY